MDKERLELWDVITNENFGNSNLLHNVDELYPDEEIGFYFRQEGKLCYAVLGKGNYQNFACAYYLAIENGADLFNNKNELRVCLEHLLKFE